MPKRLIYHKIHDRLKQEILSERYPIGSLLPTEAELEAEFAASRTSIRKAMRMLAEESYVEIKQGRGTRVLNFKAKQSFNRVYVRHRDIAEKGL